MQAAAPEGFEVAANHRLTTLHQENTPIAENSESLLSLHAPLHDAFEDSVGLERFSPKS